MPNAQTVDLRSDTFTLPSEDMRRYVSEAQVGDDYYGEDPSVNRLEEFCCRLTGKQAAVFTSAGMLSNQLAIASQTQPGNEVITEAGYHVNLYESAQYARFCQVVLNARETADGILRVADVERAIQAKPREPMYAQVKLVSVENTVASRQGRVFPFEEFARLGEYARQRAIRLHLDGARLFNAHIRSGIAIADYAKHADTVSLSFSKCLGAPFGSILVGDGETIAAARRLRMWHGSGYHQIGFCAEAAYFALTNQLDRLREDHRLTALLDLLLRERGVIESTAAAPETNMIFVDFARKAVRAEVFAEECGRRGVLLFAMPPDSIRLVVSRNVDEAGIRLAADVIAEAHGVLCMDRRAGAAAASIVA